MSNTIIGLDVSSSRTGYSILRGGRWRKSRGSYGTIIPKGNSLAERLSSFRDQLEKLLVRNKPSHIVIEDVFSGPNISTMKLLARFSGVAIEVCYKTTGLEPLVVNTTKVRSTIGCGKGKEEAFGYICERFNLDWSFSKHNDIADALLLSLYYHKLLSGKV